MEHHNLEALYLVEDATCDAAAVLLTGIYASLLAVLLLGGSCGLVAMSFAPIRLFISLILITSKYSFLGFHCFFLDFCFSRSSAKLFM